MKFGWMKGTTLRDVIRQPGGDAHGSFQDVSPERIQKNPPTRGKAPGEREVIGPYGFSGSYSRRPLMSLTRDRIMLQLQLTTPGKGSMTVCRKTSISSAEAATAWTWSLSLPVTR